MYLFILMPQHILMINSTKLEYVEQFNYLGSIKTDNTSCTKDINSKYLNGNAQVGPTKQHLERSFKKTQADCMANCFYKETRHVSPKILIQNATHKSANIWFYRCLLRTKY